MRPQGRFIYHMMQNWRHPLIIHLCPQNLLFHEINVAFHFMEGVKIPFRR